jgi:hypothetical protein
MARSRSKSPKRGGATSPAARRKTPQAADVQVVDTAMLEGIKCAVIGACGFLGSAIVKRLTRTGIHAVVAIDVVDPVDPVCDDDGHRVSYVTPPMDTTTRITIASMSSFLGFYSADFHNGHVDVLVFVPNRATSTGLRAATPSHHLTTSCQTVPLAKSSHPIHTTWPLETLVRCRITIASTPFHRSPHGNRPAGQQHAAPGRLCVFVTRTRTTLINVLHALRYVRADARDAEALADVMEAFGINLVFHCASVIDLCPVSEPHKKCLVRHSSSVSFHASSPALCALDQTDVVIVVAKRWIDVLVCCGARCVVHSTRVRNQLHRWIHP